MLQVPVRGTVNPEKLVLEAAVFWKQVEAVSSMTAETVGRELRAPEDPIVIESVLPSDSAAVAMKVTA
jgi:hypothetical protein